MDGLNGRYINNGGFLKYCACAAVLLQIGCIRSGVAYGFERKSREWRLCWPKLKFGAMPLTTRKQGESY
jgi:hypothetical protein